jgi:hypothetical protein
MLDTLPPAAASAAAIAWDRLVGEAKKACASAIGSSVPVVSANAEVPEIRESARSEPVIVKELFVFMGLSSKSRPRVAA